MSIIQVLVGFGLASILGLVLAEMNSSSSKQMGQMRLQFERAAVIQSLQSTISNSQVCQLFLVPNQPFGPIVTDNKPSAGVQSIKANWFGTVTGGGQPIVEGQQVPNTSLKVDWIRAVSPHAVTGISLPPPQQVYESDLHIKLSPITGGAGDYKMDLKSIYVGKVYFVTSDVIPTGKVTSCYGDAAGAYLCPNKNDIQVISSSGSWICSNFKQAMGQACGKGQVLQSTAAGAANCLQLYTTNAGCSGGGTTTFGATCTSEVCGATSTSTPGSSGSTTYNVTNVSITVPSLDLGGPGFGGASVVTGTSCSSSGGTGSMPGGTSCSSSYVNIPALGAGHNATNSRVITGGSGTVTVPNSTTSTSTALKYKACNSGLCTATAAATCNNTPQ